MTLLFDILDKYCRWVAYQDIFDQLRYKENETMHDKLQESISSNSSEINIGVKKRRRRNSAINLEEYLHWVNESILNKHLKFIPGRLKNKSTSDTSYKGRSSNYIGVSRNGDNWQALINCNNTKKYIGTFSTEKEAAISYDFYAICLHLFKAKTNFTYTSELILEMIDSYDSTSKAFNASQFVERL